MREKRSIVKSPPTKKIDIYIYFHHDNFLPPPHPLSGEGGGEGRKRTNRKSPHDTTHTHTNNAPLILLERDMCVWGGGGRERTYKTLPEIPPNR